MQAVHRILLSSALVLVLAACEGMSGTSSGSPSVATSATGGDAGNGGKATPGGFSGAAGGTAGTKDTVVVTPSVPGTVSVTAGSSQTISITFTSSDGRPMRGLELTGTALPADWSGTENYACTLIGAGSSCVLNLTYAPKAAESGSLTITYVYINNANEPITPGGTITIPYVATAPNNNVVAASAPTGQIISAPGSGAQSVTINFTTDDGNAATDLAVTTDLRSLPVGWTSAGASFACPIVGSGNGCQLLLKYAPAATGSGTLTLNYGYADSSGAARLGTLNIPYSTTTNGTVVATASPTGQINAVQMTGHQAVAVTFTTDDGKAATSLQVMSDLSKLPAGWSSSADKFTCGSVSGGNSCQLTLTYSPGAIASGTLSLDYSYRDAAGTYNVGSFDIAYAATTDDNVVGTAAPSGQINAIVGSASPAVAVTFTTDDGRPATALQLTTSLASLPTGWTTTQSTFACSGVNGDSSCQLPLTYTPIAAESGTLTLAYKYNNDAGRPKTGTVDIPYKATTDNNVVGTSSPAALTVLTGSTTPVSVTFVTNDGNPASDLIVTSGLTPLPAGWSGAPASFTCSSISSGSGCQLALSYAPSTADSGSLTLTFSYSNDSGLAKTGTVTIPYSASP